jgi:heme/copper-type cytochrome/quinol oxidase subunit 3
MLVNAWLLATGNVRAPDGAPIVHNRMRATGLYWYFVDVVWVVLLVLLYVV